MDENEVVSVGGRRFVPTAHEDLPFEQYGYIQKACSDAGMTHELIARLGPTIASLTNGEQPSEEVYSELAEKILMRAFQDRAYLAVLAGSLVEDGQEWSSESAALNKEFFAKCKGSDIPKLHSVIVQAMLGFFVVGLRSRLTSPSSSDALSAVGAMGVDEVTLSPKLKSQIALPGVPALESTPT